MAGRPTGRLPDALLPRPSGGACRKPLLGFGAGSRLDLPKAKSDLVTGHTGDWEELRTAWIAPQPSWLAHGRSRSSVKVEARRHYLDGGTGREEW